MKESMARNEPSRVSVKGFLFVVAIIATFAQLVSALVLLFGDIGFYFPGRYGLTFAHFVTFMGVYLFSLPVGLIASAACNRWKYLMGAQLAILAIGLTIIAIMEMPPPPVEAANFQHLVGRDISAMKEELGDNFITSGWESTPEGEFDWYSFNGLTVYVNPSTDIIDHISPNWRAEERVTLPE